MRWLLVLLLVASAHADEVDDLLARLGRGTSAERRETVAALAAHGSSILARLEPMLGSEPNPGVRAAACDVLAQLGSRALPSLDRLMKVARDLRPEPRSAALLAIAAIGPPARIAGPFLRKCAEERNYGDRGLAMYALISVRRDDTKLLESLFRNRLQIATTLPSLSRLQQTAAPLVEYLVRSSSESVREAVLRYFIYSRPSPRFWIRLLQERVIQEPVARLRGIAMKRLAAEGGLELRAFVEEQTSHADTDVRNAALHMLDRLPPADSSRAAFRRAVTHTDELTFALAAAGLRHHGVRDKELLRLLDRARKSENEFVRKEGALLYILCGGRREWAISAAVDAVLAKANEDRHFRLAPWPVVPRPPAEVSRYDAATVLRSAGALPIPLLRDRGFRMRSGIAAALLAEYGAPAREALEKFRSHKRYYAQSEAVLALIDIGDRRRELAKDLARHLHWAGGHQVRDYAPFRTAFVALGRERLPLLLAEYKRRKWKRDSEPYDVLVHVLAAFGAKTPEGDAALALDVAERRKN